jgi:hypothetical protein
MIDVDGHVRDEPANTDENHGCVSRCAIAVALS